LTSSVYAAPIRESDTIDAMPKVLYGKTSGGVLKPLLVDSDGNLQTSASSSGGGTSYDEGSDTLTLTAGRFLVSGDALFYGDGIVGHYYSKTEYGDNLEQGSIKECSRNNVNNECIETDYETDTDKVTESSSTGVSEKAHDFTIKANRLYSGYIIAKAWDT